MNSAIADSAQAQPAASSGRAPVSNAIVAPKRNLAVDAYVVPIDWHYNFTGFLAHWNKNSNLGQAFDVWFLNLFPREHPFLFNDGGYLTLSFIPTLGTMLLGLAAGRWLRL
jgi:heparan-alpha-glucosaminide N-acetyltransferase